MKPLYDHKYKLTKLGRETIDDFDSLVRDWFLTAVADGISPRELSHAIQGVLIEIELDAVLEEGY